MKSENYSNFGDIADGTHLHIHPTAWSGSATDVVLFAYSGGPDGPGRGF